LRHHAENDYTGLGLFTARRPGGGFERSGSPVRHPGNGVSKMKKLTLDLDRLAVDSFHPADEDAPVRGTVRGMDLTFTDPRVCPHTQDWNCASATCP
jgi:hypothetical protein